MLPLSGMRVFVVRYLTNNPSMNDFLAVFHDPKTAEAYAETLREIRKLDPGKVVISHRWVDRF